MSYTYTAPNKAPYSILDHALDLSLWLAEGEVLDVADVSCPDGKIEVSNWGIDGTKVTWRVSGGLAGDNAKVEVRFTCDTGRRDMRTVLYPIRDR